MHFAPGKLLIDIQMKFQKDTPQPLYNTVRYNTVLDITRISVGPQLVILYLLYPRHLCRRVYSFRLSVRPFVRLYVRLFVRSFVRTSVTFVEFASKFCVKVSQVMYISATTYQKAFIFGP